MLFPSPAIDQQQSELAATVFLASIMALKIVAVAGFQWMPADWDFAEISIFITTYNTLWTSEEIIGLSKWSGKRESIAASNMID